MTIACVGFLGKRVTISQIVVIYSQERIKYSSDGVYMISQCVAILVLADFVTSFEEVLKNSTYYHIIYMIYILYHMNVCLYGLHR
jgi:hypothetical protein